MIIHEIIKRKSKSTMQNVSFQNLEEFWEFLENDELKIALALREIIIDTIPNISEKLSYNVPYFKLNSNICFIWPSSITWGNVKQKGVRLGFTKGYLLDDSNHYLSKEHRKQVYWKDFSSLEEIDFEQITILLLNAMEIDSRLKSKK